MENLEVHTIDNANETTSFLQERNCVLFIFAWPAHSRYSLNVTKWLNRFILIYGTELATTTTTDTCVVYQNHPTHSQCLLLYYVTMVFYSVSQRNNLRIFKLCVKEFYMDTILNITDLHVGIVIPFPILFSPSDDIKEKVSVSCHMTSTLL